MIVGSSTNDRHTDPWQPNAQPFDPDELSEYADRFAEHEYSSIEPPAVVDADGEGPITE